MTITFALQPVLAIVAGVVILIAPKFFKYIVAVYLIVIGIIGMVRL